MLVVRWNFVPLHVSCLFVLFWILLIYYYREIGKKVLSGGSGLGGKLRPKNFRGWVGKERRGNMADCWLGPSTSPSFHLCSTTTTTTTAKTSPLSLFQFPFGSLSPMATLRSSSLNHCRCSSNSNPNQPSLLVFSGFTFSQSLSPSICFYLQQQQFWILYRWDCV